MNEPCSCTAETYCPVADRMRQREKEAFAMYEEKKRSIAAFWPYWEAKNIRRDHREQALKRGMYATP